MRILFILVLFTLLSSLSCRKRDSEKPTLENLTINDLAFDEILVLSPGEEIKIRGQIKDNKMLESYTVYLLNDFDGLSKKSTNVKYAENRTKLISGTSYNLDETFVIPQNAASGVYHGLLMVWDEEANNVRSKFFYFNIVRENQPTIEMNLPESIVSGSQLNADGLISAHGGATLKNVKIWIRSADNKQDFFSNNYVFYESNSNWNPFVDEGISYFIPESFQEKLIFRICAEDSNGNYTIFETEIIIV